MPGKRESTYEDRRKQQKKNPEKPSKTCYRLAVGMLVRHFAVLYSIYRRCIRHGRRYIVGAAGFYDNGLKRVDPFFFNAKRYVSLPLDP